MIKLKTKWFNKWAKKNSIYDNTLLETLGNLSDNLNTVNLGGGLFKIRTKRTGQGKSGGFRTLVAYKKDDKAIFIYGFSKNVKDNLDNDELSSFKKLSKDLLKISDEEFERQVELGNFYLLKE